LKQKVGEINEKQPWFDLSQENQGGQQLSIVFGDSQICALC